MIYPWVEIVHILSAIILFGTGVGTAYFQIAAWRWGDPGGLRVVTHAVVRADTWFTLPTVILQPVTGVWLIQLLGYPFASVWFAWVAGLYLLAGASWLPVVAIQLRLRRLAAAGQAAGSSQFDRLVALWTALGGVALLAMLGLLALMVLKPGLG